MTSPMLTAVTVREPRTCLLCRGTAENPVPPPSFGRAYSFERWSEQRWVCGPGTSCYRQRRRSASVRYRAA